MLPDSDTGLVLALLPAVDCRYKIKLVIPLKPLATEVTPLLLTSLSQRPVMLPPSSIQTTVELQVSIIMPSHPVCTMPPFMLPPIGKRLPVPLEQSPVAVVPLESPHCARMRIPLAHTQEVTQNNHTTEKTSMVSPTIPSPNAPKLLQQLPTTSTFYKLLSFGPR